MFGKHKKVLFAIIFSGSIALSNAPAMAWNIICGVSVLKVVTPADNSQKWEADSQALYGISKYFDSVAELQRLDLNPDGSFSDPVSNEKSGVGALSAATSSLAQSSDYFANALRIAKENGLGDEKGLQLLTTLQENTAALHSTISTQKHLPELEQLQAIALTIAEYNLHGIELSKQHLDGHYHGHAQGGEAFVIK